MQSLDTLLPQTAAINTHAVDPAARLDLAAIPAQGAVYLLTDPANTPMLLATVRNLRAALERRLTDTPTDQKSSRLQYGQLCTTLRFRTVHSPFAANWYYLQTARLLFPAQYPAMVTWRSTWFIEVDLAAPHPQFRKTNNPGGACVSTGVNATFGPIPDKHSANRLLESLDDLFDLCRYHNILIQAPHGKPCAYKEMGKCPAPCDGSIPLSAYHQQVASAAAVLTPLGYSAWQNAQEAQMTAAAAQLHFEAAGKIKNRLTRGAFLQQPPFRYMDALARFTFLSLQPGAGTSWIQPFLIHGGDIQELKPANRKNLPAAAAEWFNQLQAIAQTPIATPLSSEQAEHIALVAFHLFRGSDDAGVYLRPADLHSPEDILNAATSLLARRIPAKPLPDQASDRQQEAEPVLPMEGAKDEKSSATER